MQVADAGNLLGHARKLSKRLLVRHCLHGGDHVRDGFADFIDQEANNKVEIIDLLTQAATSLHQIKVH